MNAVVSSQSLILIMLKVDKFDVNSSCSGAEYVHMPVVDICFFFSIIKEYVQIQRIHC